ncbi:hypothetical protein CUJ84_Chr002730 [Rhizobium leguminosarum]|uniref:Uncharacterized protein n=1 Tax=Rhizobium leguminosarum TaxID=384 RepID=A0A2K9Z4B6_RHILE|nr:hypothetical protein CUJ84_Chr002730 [Rhizobium leguminosarum]
MRQSVPGPGYQACCCQSAAGLRSVGSIEAEVRLAAILFLVAAKKKTRFKLMSDTVPIKALRYCELWRCDVGHSYRHPFGNGFCKDSRRIFQR